MGLLRFFEKLGNGLIGMFFKIMIVLILILILIMFIQGLATYWAFALGTLLGMMFSGILYKFVSNMTKMELPDIFYWSFPEIAEALFLEQDQIENLKKELKDKKITAKAEVEKMQTKLNNIKVARNDLEAKIGTKTFSDLENVPKYSSRVRKALLMQLNEEPWIMELRDVKEDVEWGKYL